MTALEASFLAVERPGMPMHVAGVLVFDGRNPVTMPELRRLVTSRLRRLPRFHQVADLSPLGLFRGAWAPAGLIDLDAHLYHHRLRRPGRGSQLHALCGRIHERLLPRDRPLWEVHLIDGLEGGGQALVVKTHHSITDGIAGIEVARVLFDPEPGMQRKAWLQPTRFADDNTPSALRGLQSLMGIAFTAAGGPIAEAGPFNGPVGPDRTFATAQLPTEMVLRAKRHLGGSVDDVLLATVALGIRHYLDEVGYPEKPKALRAMVPVSTRATSPSDLGNHVTTVFIDLPLDTTDLSELVRRVATAKALRRSAHEAAGMSALIGAAGLLPNPLHESLLRFVASLPYANLVLSDVPGPDEPMYLLGRRIAACYPMIPLPPAIGLSIGTVALGGVIGIGLVADPGMLPDVSRLARSIDRAGLECARAAEAPRPPEAKPHARRAA
jgi:diacylglycerol O-acyltransferase